MMTEYPNLLNQPQQFHLHCENSGIKVMKNTHGANRDHPFNLFNLLHKLDLSLIFLDVSYSIIACSDKTVEFLNADTAEELIGKEINYFVPKRDDVSSVISNNLSVIKRKQTSVFEEKGIFFSSELTYVTFKSPWYGKNNDIVGLFCCSIPLGKQSLAEALPSIAQLGFLNFSKQDESFLRCRRNNLLDEYNFSRREYECLQYITQGKTAKMIASELDLSRRTVEGYIENIKTKAGVCTKYELIQKFINHIDRL